MKIRIGRYSSSSFHHAQTPGPPALARSLRPDRVRISRAQYRQAHARRNAGLAEDSPRKNRNFPDLELTCAASAGSGYFIRQLMTVAKTLARRVARESA